MSLLARKLTPGAGSVGCQREYRLGGRIRSCNHICLGKMGFVSATALLLSTISAVCCCTDDRMGWANAEVFVLVLLHCM